MQGIKMVDLKGQYDRMSTEINAAIQEVIDGTAFINGPDVGALRDELASFLDIPFVIPCGNGTDALQVALMALNLQPGDEVITPAATFPTTVAPIVQNSLVPVFVDCKMGTYNIEKLKDVARYLAGIKKDLPRMKREDLVKFL